MKVLFLSQRVPYPPDRGDRITTWHFLKHLLDRGALVRVGCLADEARDVHGVDELRAMDGVQQVCAPRIHRRWRKFTSLVGFLARQAMTLPFFRSRVLAAQVVAWLRDDPPDVVYVYSSSMAQYVMSFKNGLRIMQFAELDSDKWRQYAEKALFMKCIADVEPTVLPNGVDVDHFRSRTDDDKRQPHTLIFTGVMDYEPNVHGVLWFVRECWPRLRKTVPDAQLLIVGSRPLRSIRALSGRDGIEVTGRVPETPPYFDRAAVAVAPLHLARGVQNKVLEAMSM
ncbi:MAG: glycosyltransferase, partial [Planctomycetota bacterium]